MLSLAIHTITAFVLHAKLPTVHSSTPICMSIVTTNQALNRVSELNDNSVTANQATITTLIRASELNDALAQQGRAIVLFGQRSCSACRRLAPRIRRLAAERPDDRFFHIEASALTRSAFEQHEIRMLPTLCAFDEHGERMASVCAAGLSIQALREALSCLDGAYGSLGLVEWGL